MWRCSHFKTNLLKLTCKQSLALNVRPRVLKSPQSRCLLLTLTLKWITLVVKQISGITKKLIWVIKEQNMQTFILCPIFASIHVQKWTSVKHDLFRRLARDRKSDLDKEETDRQYFRAKVDLAWSLFDKQLAFNGTLLEVNNKIQQSSNLGRHATLCRDGLPECQQKFA